MTNATPSRFPSNFTNLDEVIQRLELLQREGYTSVGNWNLAQVSEHLRDWFSFMIEGYPSAPFPVNWMLWGMKNTVGKSMLRKILRSGSMASGGPTMKQTVHAAGGIDDATSVLRLKEMIERFRSHRDPYFPSPMFGDLSAAEGLSLQLIHCAHHLSFLVPKNSKPIGDDPGCFKSLSHSVPSHT